MNKQNEIKPAPEDNVHDIYDTKILAEYVNKYRHLWRISAREDRRDSDDDKYFIMESISLSSMVRQMSGIKSDKLYMSRPTL